jgi:asparagine synthetase B (glutamine-hydrolysing)
MTKICGIIDFNNKDMGNIIKDMTLVMKHEKWHDIKVYSKNNIIFGSVSIDKEKKILWNKEKTKCLIFSGILYGVDLNQILHNYEKIDFIRNLNGIFAFAVMDFIKNRVTLINDRHGFRPLFYYNDNQKLVFASEIKSVIKDKNIKREIDWKAWGDFIYFGEVHDNNTFFKNISTLPNASILIFEKGKCNIKKYWDYSEVKVDNLHDTNYFIKKGAELFNQSINIQTNDLKKADCFLTGGYDSRAIAMTIQKQGNIKLDTFTTRKEGDSYKDKNYAKEVAKYLNLKNIFVDLPDNIYKKYFLKSFYLTDGMANEHLFLMPLLEKTNKNINFDGIVGDILLRGSFTQENKIKKPYNLLLNKNKTKIIKKIFPRKISKQMIKESKFNLKNNLTQLKNNLTLYFLTNEGRRKVALNSMATILTKKESRAPFLDNDFVDFALSIPTEKKSNQFYTQILESIDQGCMKISSTRDETKTFILSRLPFVRKTRNKVFFMITTSDFLLKIVNKMGIYKKYSERNLKYNLNLFNKYPNIKELKQRKFSRDIYSKYMLHFKLWYYMFFKSP